jgi:hypothetical protein
MYIFNPHFYPKYQIQTYLLAFGFLVAYSCGVTWAGLELKILLFQLQPQECWDYWCEP